MMTVTRILVPVDFSEHSKRALNSAKTVADKFGASLHVLTVIPDPFVLPNPGSWYMPLPANYISGLRQDAEAHLHELLTPAEQTRFHAELAVALGDPYREILDYVKRMSIDLIAMGTHGRGGVARAMLGSVAEKVVRTAPCPVLTVR